MYLNSCNGLNVYTTIIYVLYCFVFVVFTDTVEKVVTSNDDSDTIISQNEGELYCVSLYYQLMCFTIQHYA